MKDGFSMGLNYAIDKLYATGWTPGIGGVHERAADGRPYPSVAQIEKEFAAAGQSLSLNFIEKYGVFRAEWRERATGIVTFNGAGFDAVSRL